MRIERADPERMTDADLAAWHRLRVAVTRADEPGEPPPTHDQVAATRWHDEADERLLWFARDDSGDLVGEARLDLDTHENTHLASVDLAVRPDARRRGVGRALFDTAVGYAVDVGRTTLEAEALDHPGPVAFAEAMGMRRVLTEIKRVLRLPDAVDAADLATGTGARRDGFTLVRWAGRCPDELVEPFALARRGMNDEPIGELDLRPRDWDADREREMALRRDLGRLRVYTVAVREEATGAVAGYTEVAYWPGRYRAEQWGTTVLPAYRGRRFGLWLKADMIEWLRIECPEITEYDTWNNADNRHMIAVNERLGYRPVSTWLGWQRSIP